MRLRSHETCVHPQVIVVAGRRVIPVAPHDRQPLGDLRQRPGHFPHAEQPLRLSRLLREFVVSSLRRRILGVATGPAEPLTGVIGR